MGNSRNLANLLGTGSTIATAKIADDAITSAKLADDSVVAAAIATDAVVADGLSSSAIAVGDLPANTVIGFNKNVTSTGYSGTSGTEAYTGLSASYTPTASNSKIIVLLSMSCGTSGAKSNYAIKWKLRRGTSGSPTFLTQSRYGFYPGPGNSAHQELFGTIAMNYVDEPNTTNAVTYGVWVENVDGTPGWNINNNSGRSAFTFIEIAV